ncbi:MAG TPA: type II toxin-antitoxin system VapC family toxin [Candidatus Baltobacteraceae bacterium]|nr:type II toxin-antitoxin system VapC family toxin [Candidatus Baltobacteraceae bacterium]
MTTLLDASAAIAWCVPDEFDREAEALLAHVAADGAIVPPLWAFEIENALRNAHRRKRLSDEDARAVMLRIASLPIRVVDATEAPAFFGAFAISAAHDMSVYDAVYLDAARRHGATLASRDRRVLDVARSLGIPTFSDPSTSSG